MPLFAPYPTPALCYNKAEVIELRRADRQLDTTAAEQVLHEAKYGTISMIDPEGLPYGVPISFAYSNGALYIHGAKAGRKVDAFLVNPTVSFCAVSHNQVPGPITPEEYDETMREFGSVRPFLSNHFTTEFRSAIATGKVQTVTDPTEKAHALRAICKKYTPFNQDYIEAAVEVGLSYTGVYKIEIEILTGKEKRL